MPARTQEQIMHSWIKNEPCKVSIICATYNHELYIREAIEGFLMQETSFPFELIIHDDVSTDATREIIREYVSKYPRLIKVILQDENTYSRGASPLIRSLLDAKGKYIALCEGDDYWVDAYKLEKQYSAINDNPGCTIVSHRVDIKDDTINTQLYKPYEKYNRDTYKFEDVLKEHFIPSLSIFFKKSAFPIVDPFYLKGIISRDITIELILLRSGFGVHLTDKMGTYRQHDSSITRKSRGCREIYNQYVRMLDVVAQWVEGERKNKLRKKERMFTLKKELCLLKNGDVSAGIRFIYLCVSRPIISAKYIIGAIRYRIQSFR